MWDIVITVLGCLLVSWLVLVAALAALKPAGGLMPEALRLLPDLLRLLRRMASDAALPRGVRIRLGLLVAYLAMPFDLIPDFIPVLGYADDVVIAALVLRSVVKRAGIEAVRGHWPGTDDGFTALCRVCGIRETERNGAR